jgi:hypothetical protein
MLFKRLVTIVPWAAVIFLAGILVHAVAANLPEADQWPRRLLRFIFAVLAGALIFGVIYIAGGLLISTLGYGYNDKPLLRLAHLTCIIGAYPAAMAAAVIFRTRHAALLLGILLMVSVHIWDHGTYLGRMVFSDPGLPLNGDFALTNMALIMITALLGGESGLRAVLPGIYRKASREGVEVNPVEIGKEDGGPAETV